MIVGQRLARFNNDTEICFHKIGYHVDLIECLLVFGLQYAFNSQYILMFHQPLDLQFSVGSQGEDPVLKCFDDLFDGDQILLVLLLLDVRVFGRDHHAVCA